MKLSVKHLRTNAYTHDEEEVQEGVEFGFWRVVEHTGAGWFPWSGIYMTQEAAMEVARMSERASSDA